LGVRTELKETREELSARIEAVGDKVDGHEARMLIVGAAMRKLVHIIYGVLKNNQPFDPDFAV